MAATVTSKGQVTIPKRIREALGIKPGSRVEFFLEDDHLVVELAGAGAVETSGGALRKYARRKAGESETDRIERVRREVAHGSSIEGRPSRHQRPSQVPSRG